jgi:hypothetical protein
MCICIYFLVSDNESENSTEEDDDDDEDDSIQSKETEVGLKSLLNDDNEGDETSIERKVCIRGHS